MSQQKHTVLTLPFVASGAVTGKRFITHAGALAGAGVRALGVAQYDVADTKDGAVDVIGTTIVELSGSATNGGRLETAVGGKATAYAAGPVVAVAMADGSDGDFIEALLIAN